MSIFKRLPKEPTHVQLADGNIELVVVHEPKVALLYVKGPLMDESAFNDISTSLRKQGYVLQVFQASI